MPDPFEAYLRTISERHATGSVVDETTYYPALENLLNAVGQTMSPEVRCFTGLKNLGAGMPDLGLFTPDQYRRGNSAPRSRQAPSRGAIEAKPPNQDMHEVAQSRQVKDYLERYGLVLVTTFREFVLVERAEDGSPRLLESFTVAPDAATFWDMALHSRRSSQNLGSGFVDYLKRVMNHPAPIVEPQMLAWLLASYAQESKRRVELAHETSLRRVQEELEEALGIKFQGAQGKDFFNSSFVQALFYGLFSAWALWCRDPASSRADARFEWRAASWSLHIPMIRPLFAGIAAPDRLGPLNLEEVMNWAGAALNRVDREAFFARFKDAHAIQYFYEPFLQEFDPHLRKQLGVWYTPPEVVAYMVSRIDRVLRDELGLALGLADDQVFILDPCCGTGSFLIEVLKRIHTTLEQAHGSGIAGSEMKAAAMRRVIGFEILPAPFVVAHLQLGLVLQAFGVPLATSASERVSVYLTNSFTGWDARSGPQTHLTTFFELEREREAASEVKRQQPILVVLGNPPYNAFAGVSPAEEDNLVKPYKEGLKEEWHIGKYNLDDLYVRFFRIAERRIVEQTGRGIVCYISNYSFLAHASFVVMRERFLSEFQSIWLDCLNGDSRENEKVTPDGRPDPSVFSTESNREGIRVGTAIGLLVRNGAVDGTPTVRFRNLWGTRKREELIESLSCPNFPSLYSIVTPDRAQRYSFKKVESSPDYPTWPDISDLAESQAFSGPQEGREKVFILPKADEHRFEVIRQYLDPSVGNDQMRTVEPRLMKPASRFDPEEVRRDLLTRGVPFDRTRIVDYIARPYDAQRAYLDGAIHPAFYWPRPELLATKSIPNVGYFITRDTAHKSPEGIPALFSRAVADYHSVASATKLFPTRLGPQSNLSRRRTGQTQLSTQGQTIPSGLRGNLSAGVRAYLGSLGYPNPDADGVYDLVWFHALAICYAPTYLRENVEAVRQGWPRVPLPANRESLESSAALGRELSSLVDPTADVVGVTTGLPRRGFGSLGIAKRTDGSPLDASRGDFDLTAGWGGGGSIVMPGSGKVTHRDHTPVERDELVSIESGGIDPLALIGEETNDIWLNDNAFWSNVPDRVWEYTVGGWRVVKKFLAYRDRDVLGRPMTQGEIVEVTRIVRRISATLLLHPRLDANYVRCKGQAYSWRPASTQATKIGGGRAADAAAS